MDISVLKSPAVLAVLAGSVLITNVVTYNMTAPAADYCAENQAALDALLQQQAEDKADLQRALEPVKGLDDNRSGGLSISDSIR
jgi:hypothetical protein